MTDHTRIPMFDVIPPEKGESGRCKKERDEKVAEPTGEACSLPEESTNAADSFLHKLASDRPHASVPWDSTGRLPLARKLAWVAVAALIAFAGIWFAGILFSRARVTLVADRAFSPFSFEVAFDTKAAAPDFPARLLPLMLLRETVKMEREYRATGQGNVSARASGIVTIYNTSATRQTLVANTRLQSPDGKIFRIDARVVVPANGNVSAQAIADQAGPDSNIGPTRFSFPGLRGTPRYEKVYAESREAFRGGALGVTTIVLEEDFTRAQEELSRETFESLLRDIRAALPQGFVILEQGATRFSVDTMSANAKVGDAVESFILTVDSGVEALVFDERQIEEIARLELRNADFLEHLPDAEFGFAYTLARPADFSAGTLALRVDGSLNMAESVNIAAVGQMIAGKHESEAQRELIAIPGIQEARIALWPFWARRVPELIDRIEVKIE